MDADRTARILQILNGRREAIADAWYRALSPTAFTGRPTVELRAEFGALTDKVISLLTAGSLARAEAESLGATLVDLRYAKPEALSMTLEVFSRELGAGLPPAPEDSFRERIGALLGAVSAGFVRQSSVML